MTEYKICSHAKVNLYLRILNKRPDRYHNLSTLFSELEFGDDMTFTPAKEFELIIKGIQVDAGETNIVTKAYRLIKSRIEKNLKDYRITLEKHIPVGAGLGGGSSNAASVLKAMNYLWDLKFTVTELEKIGSELGADVPFFINGGLQMAEGIGDKLTPQQNQLPDGLVFLLVIPSIHISTKWAYDNLNKILQRNTNHPKFAPLSESLKWHLFKNDFEGLIISTYPEIGKIKTELITSGADFASLSGSGSTVFGIYKDLQMAEKAQNLFTSYQSIITFPNRNN